MEEETDLIVSLDLRDSEISSTALTLSLDTRHIADIRPMSSDEEGTRGGTRGGDDDVALPKATVNKLIQGLSRRACHLVRRTAPLTFQLDLQSSFHPASSCRRKSRTSWQNAAKVRTSSATSPVSSCPILTRHAVTEFVLAVSSEANEICDKESKKTMLPEHILAALKVRSVAHHCDLLAPRTSN